MASLPDFPIFDTDADPTSLGIQWQKWAERLENLFIALDIDNAVRQKALLLHYGGPKLTDIYNTLKSPSDKEYKDVKVKLDKHFEPRINVTYETYSFRQLFQESDETIDRFVTRLRESAARCNFHDIDREIRDQIVMKGNSDRLRRRALREDSTLENLLSAARAFELADMQATKMEGSKIQKVQEKKNSKKKDSQTKEQEGKNCFSCGGKWPHPKGKETCPAWGVECKKCSKKNHFAKLCKTKTDIKNVTFPEISDSDSDDEYQIESIRLWHPNKHNIKAIKSSKKKKSIVTLYICGISITFQIDSGADVDVIDEHTYNKIKHKVKLERTHAKLYAYKASQPLPLLGKFTCDISNNTNFQITEVYVVKGKQRSGALLGLDTAMALGVIKIINKIKEKVKEVCPDGKIQSLVEEYDDIFHGIGKLKDVEIKLHVDESIKPKAQRHRRVPFHLRQKVEDEIHRLKEADVIEKVNKPTGWVSPIVISPKKNSSEIRMCVDMREPNKAIERTRNIIPTVEELKLEVNGATVFSKLDLKNGFHQLQLEENSIHITTFSTHLGLFRYKRLNFGTNSATEIFHEEVRKALVGIRGVINIHDDIFIWGIDQKDHDRALRELFQRLRESGLTCKLSKCEFGKLPIKF